MLQLAPMSKLPTRSPTHEDLELGRLASMGLEIEEVADGDTVRLAELVIVAEDRGRPTSHYLAATALATDLRVAGDAPLTIKVCVGTCQRYGALDLLDHLVARSARSGDRAFKLAPVTCLDRCDLAAACELHGPAGVLVLAPATTANLDEALDALG
jgi:NADH:ubiquinone oxidoreductase subunit E